MMSKRKTKGGFSKVLRLASVLQKCNGKAALGDSNALISPKAAKAFGYIGLILLTVLLIVGLWFLEPVVALIIPIPSIVQTLMMILFLLSFILAVKNIVTVLYTADDLPVLLPMPFSASEIVTAKLMVSSKFPLFLSLVLMNAVGLGFGLRAGMGATYIIGTVLSSVLIPVSGIALATLLVVIIFRVFGFIRNRDITMVLGGVFTLLFTLGYIFLNNQLQNSKSTQAVATIFSGVAGASRGFPNLSFMADFMFDGSIIGLLISVGITALVIILALLAVKLFYLATALSMQNTGTKKKAVVKGSLGSKKKANALKALFTYEARSARRNPAYLIYGFAMSFIWPLFMILPIVFGNGSFAKELKLPLDPTTTLFCSLFLGITASDFACGFNNLPITAFTREGNTFSALKTMPIDFRDYYKSKRNFSLLICSLGSAAYILILGIANIATGFVPIECSWMFLYSACISLLTNLIIINCMLLKNARKPYLTWDSETEFSRKLSWVNVISIIVGAIAMIALMVGMIVIPLNRTFELPAFSTIVAVVSAVAAVILIVAAFAVNRAAVKKAERLLSAVD